jgi:iron complex transport system substrate-binding protein
MSIDRRATLAALAATVFAPSTGRAASITDAAGRAVTIPARVARVFPAGPPAAILLYTLAPELLLGWPRANRAEECEFLLPDICRRPEVGRITGRGNTANLEVVLALKPDLILDVGSTSPTFVSLATRVQEQTGIPYALLDGRFDAVVATYRKIGDLTHRQPEADALARYADETMSTIRTRVAAIPVAAIPEAVRPRVYYARGPRGLETGLGGSINVETIEFLGALNVAGERRGGLAIVSIEQVLLWNPDVIITIDRDFRLGRLPAFGQPADRFVVARENPLSPAISRGFEGADARLLPPLLPRNAERRADRACAGGAGLTLQANVVRQRCHMLGVIVRESGRSSNHRAWVDCEVRWLLDARFRGHDKS